MNKKISCLLAIIMLCIVLVGCQSNEKYYEQNIQKLQTEIAELESQRDSLKSEIVNVKEETGNAKYVVTFNIKQTHMTLDITQHLKDSMNDISIQVPVDKEYYESLNEGDVINDSFRIGSLIFKGSFGKWKVTVEKKEIF